ncbi:MAG: hypothetical protein GDA50_04060 [Alphaproteobacteria bacterium GM202ARS2]|nr:hypothetical protein [Alphaproteobacteria bacterium GM202ARS2]
MSDMPDYPTISGKLPETLAQEVSDAIARAMQRGMGTDEAVSVVVNVAADYGRHQYGNDILPGLAELIVERGKMPLPGKMPMPDKGNES